MKYDKDESLVDLEGKQMFLKELEMILALLRVNGHVRVINCAEPISTWALGRP